MFSFILSTLPGKIYMETKCPANTFSAAWKVQSSEYIEYKELKFPRKIVADRCCVEEGRPVGQCTKATAENTFGVSCLMGGKEFLHVSVLETLVFHNYFIREFNLLLLWTSNCGLFNLCPIPVDRDCLLLCISAVSSTAQFCLWPSSIKESKCC